MSGQPYRYVKDIENFRNEYMDALNLRANIDDMNFQANKIYKETGALPPKSTMKDMRTTAEILMDVEKLKLNIIGEFKGLATPQMIQLVLQRVQASPLNGDGSFLVWFAQNAKEIAQQLKKKYTYGIAGDDNDAENMYLFISETFSKTKEYNGSIKSSFDRPINSLNSSLQPGDLDAIRKKYNVIQYKLVSKQLPRGSIEAQLIRDINDKFNALSYTITTDKYNEVKNIFLMTSIGTNSITQQRLNALVYNDWLKFTEKIPSSSSLNTLLDQLYKSEKNSDPTLTIKILENINSILPPLSEIDRINDITDNIIATNGTPPSTPVFGLPVNSAGAQMGAVGSVLNPAPAPAPLPVVPAPLPVVPVPTGPNPVVVSIANRFFENIRKMVEDVTAFPVIDDDNKFKQYINGELLNIEDFYTSRAPNWKTQLNYDHNTMVKALESLTNNYNLNETINYNYDKQAYIDQYKFFDRGNASQIIGIGLHRRAGRPRGSGIVKPLNERIDKTQGIKQGHTHVPFGKYIINKNRLDDDIFSFKHVKGYGVKGYPSKKISRNLSNVIKTIIGGGVPKFNELANLSEDEKEYLHTVSSKAGIMDKLSVPTPSKDSMEQDVHSFNVMKGEILAGNDSSVLIKKFKLLLLKLSKNGSLPKRECQEIMEDLIQLGY